MLLGSSMLGLRSLASGLPTWFLANPLQSAAQIEANLETARTSQYMILNTSTAGDPVNCNVPGTYLDPGIAHPLDPTMAPTSMSIGGQSYQAAKPWSTLSADVLKRTAFIHHSTLTNNHANHAKVMEMMGAIRNQEMLVSIIARNIASNLVTVQPEPVDIGGGGPGEQLQFEGRSLPLLSAPALSAIHAKSAQRIAGNARC
jgi:hypothetical protein